MSYLAIALKVLETAGTIIANREKQMYEQAVLNMLHTIIEQNDKILSEIYQIEDYVKRIPYATSIELSIKNVAQVFNTFFHSCEFNATTGYTVVAHQTFEKNVDVLDKEINYLITQDKGLYPIVIAATQLIQMALTFNGLNSGFKNTYLKNIKNEFVPRLENLINPAQEGSFKYKLDKCISFQNDYDYCVELRKHGFGELQLIGKTVVIYDDPGTPDPDYPHHHGPRHTYQDHWSASFRGSFETSFWDYEVDIRNTNNEVYGFPPKENLPADYGDARRIAGEYTALVRDTINARLKNYQYYLHNYESSRVSVEAISSFLNLLPRMAI